MCCWDRTGQARPGSWRCCARRSKARKQSKPASRPHRRLFSAIATSISPILPMPTLRCARSSDDSMSAISVPAHCSPAPACRSRCRAARSASFPADRRRVSACFCCGLPSQTSIYSMSLPTTWISKGRKRWKTN